MKKSPVQIVEIFYPVVSYEANQTADSATFDPTITVDMKAGVAYCSDNEHMARLTISQKAVAENLPYSFNLEAYAVFAFDKESAKELYGDLVVSNLAVNVVSILFSSAREALAHATSRGPYGPVYIEGIVVDATSVEIHLEEDPRIMIPRLFGIDFPAADESERIEHEGAQKTARKRAKK